MFFTCLTCIFACDRARWRSVRSSKHDSGLSAGGSRGDAQHSFEELPLFVGVERIVDNRRRSVYNKPLWETQNGNPGLPCSPRGGSDPWLTPVDGNHCFAVLKSLRISRLSLLRFCSQWRY